MSILQAFEISGKTVIRWNLILNLLNEKYVFQKRKRILWNPLWTTGSTSKELRGSLANFPCERGIGLYGPSDPRWTVRIRSEEEGGGTVTGEEAVAAARHRRRRGILPAKAYRTFPATIWLRTCPKRKRETRRSHLAQRWGRIRSMDDGGLAEADDVEQHTTVTRYEQN